MEEELSPRLGAEGVARPCVPLSNFIAVVRRLRAVPRRGCPVCAPLAACPSPDLVKGFLPGLFLPKKPPAAGLAARGMLSGWQRSKICLPKSSWPGWARLEGMWGDGWVLPFAPAALPPQWGRPQRAAGSHGEPLLGLKAVDLDSCSWARFLFSLRESRPPSKLQLPLSPSCEAASSALGAGKGAALSPGGAAGGDSPGDTV